MKPIGFLVTYGQVTMRKCTTTIRVYMETPHGYHGDTTGGSHGYTFGGYHRETTGGNHGDTTEVPQVEITETPQMETTMETPYGYQRHHEW